VKKVYFIYNPKTGYRENFGYLEFLDPQSAKSVLQSLNHQILDCTIRALPFQRKKDYLNSVTNAAALAFVDNHLNSARIAESNHTHQNLDFGQREASFNLPPG